MADVKTYIEREAVLEKARLACYIALCDENPDDYPDVDFSDEFAVEVDEICELPAADVAPVVHGEWVDHMCRDWRCSECDEKINKVRNVDGYCYDDKPNYCPNCGAKMDGGKNDAADS